MFDDNDEENPAERIPLYLKGEEIYELTSKIVDLIPEENDILISYKQLMVEDALMLIVKVSGAEAVDLYDIKMENAAIIRKSARDLITHLRGLETYDFKEVHYLDLIREAIEEYRKLFVDWVKNFDKWNYVVDKWGLFNPPGVDPNDYESKRPNDD